ncbi:MAG: response regulator transcription factor [Sphingobacteriales bacterium]|nr:MAG: response regulator transcription factor [Sphingobacteriales bacterium]
MKMPYKTIIVDDESHALNTLKRYIEKMPDLILTGAYENPIEALTILSGPEPPQLAFLDIDMPELSGLALAELANQQVEIVFTSAHQQFAMEAFGLQVSGYLLKPFSFESFYKTVHKVCSRISPETPAKGPQPLFFSASSKGKYLKIMSEDILYIEAMLNYVKIYTLKNESPKIIYLSLKQATTRFGGTHLIRISRSFVINTVHLEIVEGNTATMSDGKKIVIGPTYRDALYQYLKMSSGKTKT